MQKQPEPTFFCRTELFWEQMKPFLPLTMIAEVVPDATKVGHMFPRWPKETNLLHETVDRS